MRILLVWLLTPTKSRMAIKAPTPVFLEGPLDIQEPC